MENQTTQATAQAPKYDPQKFIEQADQAYLTAIKSGNYNRLIADMVNLGDYSLRNQMLILQQRPNATKVNTMNGWNYRKRHVTKGSESLKILAPIFDKIVYTNADGKIAEKKLDFITGYNINGVFDISQTEGEPPLEWITGKTLSEEYAVVEKALKETLNGYTFAEKEMDAEGMLDTRRKTITLNSGLDKEAKINALIRQIAAALVVGRNRDRFQGLRAEQISDITAVETSAAAHIVARKLGLEGGKLIEPDFANMSDDDIQKFSNNVGVVRSISQLMITGIENALSASAAEKKLAAVRASEAGTETVTATTTVRTTTKSRSKAQAEM